MRSRITSFFKVDREGCTINVWETERGYFYQHDYDRENDITFPIRRISIREYISLWEECLNVKEAML